MIRDQIVVGTLNEDIRNNALKNNWELDDLVKNSRQLGAAKIGASKIIKDDLSIGTIQRVKPKKYSTNDEKQKTRNYKDKRKCMTCSSKSCKGEKNVRRILFNALLVEKRDIFVEQRYAKANILVVHLPTVARKPHRQEILMILLQPQVMTPLCPRQKRRQEGSSKKVHRTLRKSARCDMVRRSGVPIQPHNTKSMLSSRNK